MGNSLLDRFHAELAFSPTRGQAEVMKQLTDFIVRRKTGEVFVLKGYAGTGKTSIVGAMTRAVEGMGAKLARLAPTGRAAKVFAEHSGGTAWTIHKYIYRQKGDGYGLFYNKEGVYLFVVDEASMINNGGGSRDVCFGSGRLLDDLITFVYGNGSTSKLILIGDEAQLPPVGQDDSPALSRRVLESYGLDVEEGRLTEVVRQATQSGILRNATLVREALTEGRYGAFPRLETKGRRDFRILHGAEATDALEDSLRRVGVEETVVITRSNARATRHAADIRGRVIGREDTVGNGDLLMVVKNNYLWSEPYEETDFIANGDTMEVVRTGRHTELYGLNFVDLTLRPVHGTVEIEAKVLENLLYAMSREEVAAVQDKLFAAVEEDYMDIRNLGERMKAMRKDPYLNALQMRFAYAVTCHKAQGGQWKHVYIDHSGIGEEAVGRDYYRWLYTAITRGREKVYLMNFDNGEID